MKRERETMDQRRRWVGCVAGLAIVATMMACTGAEATSTPAEATPSASAGASGSSTPSASVEGGNPTESPRVTPNTWTPSPAPIPTVEPEPEFEGDPEATPTPTPLTGPLPSLNPAPEGYWKEIKWVPIPSGHSPALPAPVEGAPDANGSIAGWSEGYVEFVWDPRKRTVTPWASTDGMTWTVGTKLDTSGWAAEFKGYDADVADYLDEDPQAKWECSFVVVQFKEGPTTLVLRGQVLCMGGCGGPWYTQEKMWISADGLSWSAVDMPLIFGAGGVGRMSAGSSGLIALGYESGQHTVWTSTDAQSWHKGALPPEVLLPSSTIGDPVSFAGGYVLPGVLLVSKGPDYWEPEEGDYQWDGYAYRGFQYYGGCASGMGDLTSRYRGALWWSADGTEWTRINLSSLRTAADTSLELFRMNDHTIVAWQSVYTGYSQFDISWVSTDGKSWTQFHGWPVNSSSTITHFSRGIVYDWQRADGALTFRGFDDKLNLIVLKQSGETPWIDYWQMALGPNGILVTDDGSHFWMGVPIAG